MQMIKMNISAPPMLNGSITNQVSALYSYLYSMSEQLNVAIQSINDNTVEVTESISGSGYTGNSADRVTAAGGEYESLKALIIKSADEVNNTITILDKQIRQDVDDVYETKDNVDDKVIGAISDLQTIIASTYVAQSEFGSYAEQLNTLEEYTREGRQELYDYNSALTADMDNLKTTFEKYIVETSGYIKYGIVEYDGAVPQFGIAVGQNLTTETVTVDGVDYDRIIEKDFRAVFTATALKFYMNSTLVAYMSNERLHIVSAEVDNISISQQMILGDEWIQYKSADGLIIEYIGG